MTWHQLTVAPADLHGEPDKKSGDAALHFSTFYAHGAENKQAVLATASANF